MSINGVVFYIYIFFFRILFKILHECYIFSKSFYKLQRDTMYLKFVYKAYNQKWIYVRLNIFKKSSITLS